MQGLEFDLEMSGIVRLACRSSLGAHTTEPGREVPAPPEVFHLSGFVFSAGLLLQRGLLDPRPGLWSGRCERVWPRQEQGLLLSSPLLGSATRATAAALSFVRVSRTG